MSVDKIPLGNSDYLVRMIFYSEILLLYVMIYSMYNFSL